MAFSIKNKVALVTGGASGIGLNLVKELLKNEAKGVTIADIDESGDKIVKALNQEYGSLKVIFVKTDISNASSFENAFKVTVDHFKNLDIFCNNAGILNENDWEKTVDINLKGTIIGMILAQDNYIKNHKQGEEGIIINTASIAGIAPIPVVPFYTATKFGVVGLTKSFGQPTHFNNSGVKVIAILPNVTNTPLLDMTSKPVDENLKKFVDSFSMQSPDFVAKETIGVIEKASNGSLWVIDQGKPAYEFALNPLFGDNDAKSDKL